MANTIVILNGPNLNMLGKREPEIYGGQTLDEIRNLCTECASSLYMKLDFHQTNHEGELIGWVHQAGANAQGIILNPAGFGHSSVALLDAVISVDVPTIEVHLSNIYKREDFRRHTYTSQGACGVIGGFGGYSYLLAIYALNEILKKQPNSGAPTV